MCCKTVGSELPSDKGCIPQPRHRPSLRMAHSLRLQGYVKSNAVHKCLINSPRSRLIFLNTQYLVNYYTIFSVHIQLHSQGRIYFLYQPNSLSESAINSFSTSTAVLLTTPGVCILFACPFHSFHVTMSLDLKDTNELQHP